MKKKEQDAVDRLMGAARDAAFEAAEAMDRADIKTWNALQDRAEALRNKARKIGTTKAPVKATRKKGCANRTGRSRQTKR